MKEILPNVFALEVSMDAINFKWNGEYLDYYSESENAILHDIPKQYDWGVLGTVTETEISFDVEPYVEVLNLNFRQKMYFDYVKKEYSERFTANDSFRSALTANDFHFTNPMGEKPMQPWQDKTMEEGLHERYKLNLQKWQTAESNLVKKLLILNRK